jgi:hypothetical protein
MYALKQAQQHDAEVEHGRMSDTEVFREYGPEVLGVPVPEHLIALVSG